MLPAPLNLTVTVDPEGAPELHAALAGLQPNQRSARLIDYARIGHLMASLSEVGLNNQGIREYFGELTVAMDNLEVTVTEATEQFRARRTATHFGQQGEAYVAARLTEVFAGHGDEFTVWSATGHQGDIRATVGGQKEHTVLIEVKNQTAGPSAPELKRFQQDVRDLPHAAAAMFVSLQSKIPGMKSPVDITDVDGRTVLYISQAEASEQLFVIGWGVLREWVSRRTSLTGRMTVAEAIARLSARRIRAEVAAFEEAASSDASRVGAMRRHLQAIQKSADSLQKEADSLEASIGLRARGLARFLSLEADSLEESERIDLDAPPLSLSEFRAGLNTIGCPWSRHEATLTALYELICNYDNVETSWAEDSLTIIRNDVFCLELTGGKTYLQIEMDADLFPGDDDEDSPEWHHGRPGTLRFKARRNSTLDLRTLKAVLDAADC